MTAHGFDIVSLHRWVGGPGGHEEELGIVAFDEAGKPCWVDASLERTIRIDLPDDWTRAEFGHRYRADRTAVASATRTSSRTRRKACSTTRACASTRRLGPMPTS